MGNLLLPKKSLVTVKPDQHSVFYFSGSVFQLIVTRFKVLVGLKCTFCAKTSAVKGKNKTKKSCAKMSPLVKIHVECRLNYLDKSGYIQVTNHV